jgi:signal transduction histidine kinase
MDQSEPALAVPATGPSVLPSEEFVYAISHDLRGPLLNFQGFLRRLRAACEVLESQSAQWDLNPEQRQVYIQLLEQKLWPSLEVLDRNARRMDRLLGALLELSLAGRDPPQPQRVATMELVRGVVEEFGPVALDKKAALNVGPLPDLWADPERVEQILRRLLSNALNFLSPDRPGEVTLGGEATAGEVTCWARDNGIGIKPQDQARIFSPFGKVRQIETPGEGVGLAIVQKLVRQQGGQVWVDSIPGQGSTFYFSLPRGPVPSAVRPK